MSIDITITDAMGLSHCEKRVLAAFFAELADSPEIGETPSKITRTETEKIGDVSRSVTTVRETAPTHFSPPTRAIAPNDVPNVGAPDLLDEAAAAFGKAPSMPVPAPSHVATETNAPPANVITDTAGLPYDARIHSSSRTMTKGDGKWKYKRGVEDGEIAQVETELRRLMGLEAPVRSAIVPAMTMPVPVPQASDGVTFSQFSVEVMDAVSAGRVTHAQVAAVCVAHGLPAFPSLMTRPDYIPAVRAALFGHG